MKYFIPAVALACHILGVANSEAAEESLSSLPPVVRETAHKLIGRAKIEEVEDTYENGGRAYEVEFERDGKKMAIVLSPGGKLIQTEHRLSVEDTPSIIKEAVRTAIPGATISHVKEIEKNGKTYFEISARTEGGTKGLKLDTTGKPLPPSKD